MPQSHLKYRPDIDGLRSIAVLGVLFFHVGFGPFSGGWVGVDVFFVISGFLITRLIATEVEAGTFSFGNFYVRRARRLFSGFVFTVALSFAVGSLVFNPVYLQRFGGEIVYALAAIPNIYFWREGGYFEIAAEYKPLLHTWSLGVEEQFYAIWPLAIVLTFRYVRKYAWLLLASAFVVSLLLAEYYFYLNKGNAVFFLLPSRIFEFAIGAATVWLVKYQPARNLLLEVALLAGLGMIGASVFWFSTTTPFPTLYALIPCFGTALAIFGGTARNTGLLLRNRPMVGIGKISYSLYLVHWPTIVFYKYNRLDPISPSEQALICVFSVVAAALMYRFIEQPFRGPAGIRFSSRAALGLACATTILVLVIPASIVWAKGTLAWRGPSSQMGPIEVELFEQRKKEEDLDDRIRASSFSGEPGVPRFLFMGDSHSGDIAAAMVLALGSRKYEFARISFDDPCFSSRDRKPWILRLTGTRTECEAQIESLRGSELLPRATHIFIANYWTEDTLKGFDEGLALLRKLTPAKIILVGQNATFPAFDVSLRYLDRTKLHQVNKTFFEHQSLTDLRVNAEMRRVALERGLAFIDRQPLVCSDAKSECQVVAPDDKLLYSDRTHWSYEGRKIFGEMMLEKYRRVLLSNTER